MSSGPPARGVIDTPLLVLILGGDPAASRFALDMLRYHLLETSQFSAMVAIAASQDAGELQVRLRILGRNLVHRVTANISRRAFRILEQRPPPCGLTADDAVVAATAVEHKLPLYTLDPARFAAVPGLTATRPY